MDETAPGAPSETESGGLSDEPAAPSLKVVYLTPGCFDKGGISRYSRYQVTALRELVGASNVEVLSVLGPDDQSFEAPFEVRFAAGGIGRRHKLAFVAEAFSVARTERPSLVLAAHVNLAALGWTLARAAGAQSALNVYGGEVRAALRLDAELGLRGAHHLVSDCHATARFVERRGLRPRGSTSVVWDCVDLGRFHPGPVSRAVLERYGIPDPRTRKNILTLGRLSSRARHKGYERLLDVFARLGPSAHDARLVYAGGGDLIEPLRARAAALGLGERVVFTGPIHEADMANVYRSAHVFSLVSDRVVGGGEGIPLTPLEAAACGVPILVGDQDGSEEAIVDDANGFIVPPFDLDGHAEKLRLLLTDEARRVSMARAAVATVRAQFAYEGFRDKHWSLLASWFPRDVRLPPGELPTVRLRDSVAPALRHKRAL